MDDAILVWLDRKQPVEQRLKESEGVSYARIWGKREWTVQRP